MRHSVRYRPKVRGATPRRLSAAERALSKERDRYALFADQLVQPTPEERITKFDTELLEQDQGHRDLAAGHWWFGRKLGKAYPDVLAAWNKSGIPPDAHYFADFMRNEVRERLRKEIEVGFTGEVVCRLMRKFRRTIRGLSNDIGITMKRIREVRSEGLTDPLPIRDWVEAISGIDPGQVH